MADIFISYSSEDRERVRPLAEALEAQGFSVWWDRQLGAGDDYAQVIARELAGAKAVIVAWSKASAASPWVRDEAGRAREDGRLVPILLDPVELPLGFGAIHTEDFSAWNGAKGAAQVQILSEVLKARIAGETVDGAAVAARRKRLMGRIRIVSVLSAVAALVGIAAGVSTIINANKPPPTPVVEAPVDQLSLLLQLVNEGKISGEQALELARLLQSQAFADIPAPQQIAASAPSTGDPAPAAPEAPMVRNLEAGGVEVAAVTDAEMAQASREAYADAAAQLLQDPDPAVRAAVIQVSNPATRVEGMNALWAIGEQGGASAAAVWRATGALMTAMGEPRAQDALERARTLNPQDKRVWRLLSVAYDRKDQEKAAAAAALVGEGLNAAAEGDREAAAATLQQALPLVEAPEQKAFVLGQLGDAAAARSDWAAAERHYKSAVDLRARLKDQAGVSMESAKLARTLVQRGERASACRTLRRAEAQGASVSPEEMAAACGPAPDAPDVAKQPTP